MKNKIFKPEAKISLKTLKASSEEAAIQALEQMSNSVGWRLTKEALQLNIKAVEDMILQGGVDEKELDLLREQRLCYLDLLDTPDHLIGKIKGVDIPFSDDVELDPYEKLTDPN